MFDIFPYLLFGLVILVCPLMMVATGVVVWVVGRFRGERKEFSAACMGDHSTEAATGMPGQSTPTRLTEEMARLEGEIAALRLELKTGPDRSES